MAVLEIKRYPAVVLKEKAVSVSRMEPRHHRLIDDMIETMYAAPGVGLAAPQVGVSERIIVIDVGIASGDSLGQNDGNSSLIVLINPDIIAHEGEVESEEGCLSIPGLVANIARFERVAVKGLDRAGKKFEVEAEGLLARALQHEIDHLEGTLILDRVSFLKREFYKKRLKKEALSKS